MSGPVVKVRRQWNDYRIAIFDIDKVTGLHWDNESGGVHATAPQYFVHGYVMCNAMISGELAHSCSHGEGPHRIKVCLTKKGNEAIWPEIMERLNTPSPKISKARTNVEALARGIRESVSAERRGVRKPSKNGPK